MAGKVKQKLRVRRRPAKFRVGDQIRFDMGASLWDAVIIEDRGKLGVGGRRIWRVRTTSDSPGAKFETEVPEDELIRVT